MADTPTFRERARRAARAEITDTALRLFAENGFEATTIDQITSAVGISRRSFFHYFGSKEDLVLGDTEALGESVRAALEERPEDESAWTAIRAAFLTIRPADKTPEEQFVLARLHHEAPSLRARHLEKHLRWQTLLAPGVQRRLGLPPSPDPDPRALAFVAAALACFDAAVDAWFRSGGADDPVRLFDEAVATLRS
ncbi:MULTISPECIES: TetR/AcrR family transcriptional regulator [Streptomyces]|uniref:TetR/AcrR family transcriptional regulator n=1 Tax=Streptomyces TaxID=1883 RepID=UPI00188575BD|nr:MULTISPECIES: TetR/AcrR family transcriptional regulator [Streptomyces]MBF8174248.1 TetR family transcriptional regulator [Streptomyces olivaceus]MBZ6130520.1 TetR/AcrR family transcriptional regulator; helix-turn-helix transcriptional regulator [Streptomyces olivaceus]MBZ6251483.1 TetR/AcrR family transcriptional regulator; helix-turn-helix transcriptional regulator [Streptomyces olivaceus]MCU8591622.1 TetR/AcrR family transcriptional regulator [Streptomyces sp. A13(2022)]UOG80129.1 TetR/A